MKGRAVLLGSLLAAAGCYGAYDTTGTTATAGGDAGATPADTGTAGDAAPPDTSSTAVVCTSGTTWSGGEGPSMEPGNACISCHSQGEGPAYKIAGTVYPTVHEPDRCDGAPAVNVVITDSAGTTFTLPTNSAGNFACGTRARSGFPACANLVPPYSAKVTDANGAERAMSAHQTTGDCNSCHTQSGASGAPGRIMTP